METKLTQVRAIKVARKAKFEGCVVVDAVGSSGSLLIMWKQEVQLKLVN